MTKAISPQVKYAIIKEIENALVDPAGDEKGYVKYKEGYSDLSIAEKFGVKRAVVGNQRTQIFGRFSPTQNMIGINGPALAMVRDLEERLTRAEKRLDDFEDKETQTLQTTIPWNRSSS